MIPLISVIVPTHNPNVDRLKKVFAALKAQKLRCSEWELILVDNASTSPQLLLSNFDISWNPLGKILREDRLGLTWARIAGIQASQSNYLVFVDDDNVIDANYLENTIKIFQQNPELGAIGGKSLPEFEVKPELWVKQFWGCLALRDLGEDVQTYRYGQVLHLEKQHPVFAPIGAGMALRKSAAKLYVKSILENQSRLVFDRIGKSLQSGGDCDINLTLLDAGWAVGYFPQLKLTHLITANRLTKNYLARLNRASSRSWVQVLDTHNIRPWSKIPQWSVLPRKVKAFLTYQPWRSPTAYIEWQGACGMFEGLSTLS
jgi:glycosyltransferase involved in cell wall biosynthesis